MIFSFGVTREISTSEGQLKVEMVLDMFNNLGPGRRKRETVLMSPGVLLNIDPPEFHVGFLSLIHI